MINYWDNQILTEEIRKLLGDVGNYGMFCRPFNEEAMFTTIPRLGGQHGISVQHILDTKLAECVLRQVWILPREISTTPHVRSEQYNGASQ